MGEVAPPPYPVAVSVPALAMLGDPAVDVGGAGGVRDTDGTAAVGFDADAVASAAAVGTDAGTAVAAAPEGGADAGAADWPWSWPTASLRNDDFRRCARLGAGVLPAEFWSAMAIGERWFVVDVKSRL